MLAYWLLFALFAAGSLLSHADLRQRKPLGAMLLGCLVLIVMIGFRGHIGVDWNNYLRAWNIAPSMTLGRYLEYQRGDPAFYTMMWGLNRAGFPEWSYNLLCAIPFSIGLVRFARQQPNSWLAVAVAVPYLVIVIAMSTTRQATAIGFIFLALVAFKRGNHWGFMGWTFVAATFHSSAIVVLPFAGLSLAKNRFQSAALILITAVVAYFTFGSTFETYSRDYLGRYTLTSSGTIYRIYMNLLPAVIYLLVSRRLPFAEQERTLWRNFSFLAIASVPLLLVVQSSTALDRLLLYAFPLQIMMLAWVPYLFRGRAQQLGIILAILAYLALQQFVFFNYSVNGYAFIPYRNFLWD